MSNKAKDINIRNKKASYEYEFIDKYTAGIVLKGSEIKSIKQGKVSLQEGYCYISTNGELFVKNINIAEYTQANRFNHQTTRERKLLLTKQELKKLSGKLKDVGLTIVPTRMYINNRGFAKLDIALAKGKKIHDKRESIKSKDIQRDMDRGRY